MKPSPRKLLTLAYKDTEFMRILDLDGENSRPATAWLCDAAFTALISATYYGWLLHKYGPKEWHEVVS